MIRLFVGYDEREEVGSHVFNSSVIQNSRKPVSIIHLKKEQVAREFAMQVGEGTNAFTQSRFLVPALCDYAGWAIFADGADMLCAGDISELWDMRDRRFAVQVVKHDYATRNPRKYIGTKMEAENRHYARKNWASLMLINCAALSWRTVTAHYLSTHPMLDALQFKFLQDSEIGDLPKAWNWLVDEHGPNPDAKILHWTAGVPGFAHYHSTPHSDEWRAQLKRVNHATD